MKIKITQEVEKEIEINIPSYFNVSCHFYKILSDSRAIAICDLSGHESIQELDVTIIFTLGITPIEISEKAFCKKFNSVLKNLKSK